jgi:hypothetical protein
LDVARIEIDFDLVPFRSALLFTRQHVKRAGRSELAIEFPKRSEAAPLTIRVERKFLVDIGPGKTMDQRLEFSRAGAQEHGPYRHAAQAPTLDSGDSITGGVSADEVAAEKEMRVHWGKSIEAVRLLSQTAPAGRVGPFANWAVNFVEF